MFLKKRYWVEPSRYSMRAYTYIHMSEFTDRSIRYSYFRLLGQSFGAIPLVLEALRALRPHVFVGTYPITRLTGVKH